MHSVVLQDNLFSWKCASSLLSALMTWLEKCPSAHLIIFLLIIVIIVVVVVVAESIT